MENTTNFNLQKYQSGDYFNPLTVGNPNLDIIDATMKSNSNRAIGRATELVSQGVHAITLLDVDCKTFKFIATGNYSAGETFTVNGIQVNAYTPSGSALVSNAFVTGAVVIASLNEDGNAITVYVSGMSTSDDSLRLGGELPAYYATQADMTQAETDITNLQNQNGNTSIVGIGDGTTTGAISSLHDNKQSKNWTLLGTFTGAGVHDLPENFSELIISVTTGGTTNLIIPKAQLTNESKQMWLTGVANGGQVLSCLFPVSLTSIDVNYIYWAGSNITSSTPYEVYYR